MAMAASTAAAVVQIGKVALLTGRSSLDRDRRAVERDREESDRGARFSSARTNDFVDALETRIVPRSSVEPSVDVDQRNVRVPPV